MTNFHVKPSCFKLIKLYKMNKEIYNKNDKNILHGYQEWYGNNIKLWLRCNYKNGQPVGYYENHLNDWNPKITRYFIK